MSKKKRLFLFAAYDPEGVVGSSLIWYLRCLDACGDIILYMDNACTEEELSKLDGYCIHSGASRHNEYDFGSYKRAFLWASENLDLASYDYLYLVNDSVFGPLGEIEAVLEKMEALGKGAFSLVLNPHKRNPHLQSWFIGMGREVFAQEFFREFIGSVRVHDKLDVCELYESGFTRLLERSGTDYAALHALKGKAIYNDLKKNFDKGIPFIKKSAFTRHNGSLGRQIRQVLDKCSPECRHAIISDAERLYGKSYINRLLTVNIISTTARYFKYLGNKIFTK